MDTADGRPTPPASATPARQDRPGSARIRPWPLLENPHRIGRPLRGGLTALHAAHVGSCRVVYEIDESERMVIVLDVDHRAEIYRQRIVTGGATRRRPAR